MKKILLTLVICLGLASFASQTFAQSTQINPFNGATHTYGFADIDANASYEFYVVASNNHLGTAITDFGQFVDGAGAPLADGTGTIGTSVAPASIKIKWSETLSTTYPDGVYLFLKVTAQGSTCGVGNYKGVHIDAVQNDFNVAIAATPNTDPICADLTNLQPVINKDLITATDEYEAGYTTFTYTVTRTTTTTNSWTANYNVTCSDASVKFFIDTDATVETAVVGDKAKTITSATDPVTVTITMVNTPGSNPVFSLNLVSASDLITGLSDLSVFTDNDIDDDGDAAAKHTINLMPNIGDFIGS